MPRVSFVDARLKIFIRLYMNILHRRMLVLKNDHGLFLSAVFGSAPSIRADRVSLCPCDSLRGIFGLLFITRVMGRPFGYSTSELRLCRAYSALACDLPPTHLRRVTFVHPAGFGFSFPLSEFIIAHFWLFVKYFFNFPSARWCASAAPTSASSMTATPTA